jgi:hypothetical protein
MRVTFYYGTQKLGSFDAEALPRKGDPFYCGGERMASGLELERKRYTVTHVEWEAVENELFAYVQCDLDEE